MTKKYQIWDKVSPVITPIGEVLTAEQWMNRYPIAQVKGIDIVLAGGIMNGAFFGVLPTMIDMYERQGCDFSECTTNEEILDTIEVFEEEMNKPVESTEPTTDERIAAALEAQVMMSLPDDETV